MIIADQSARYMGKFEDREVKMFIFGIKIVIIIGEYKAR